MGALKVLVALMGVLIVAGTVTLVVLIVQRTGGGGDAAARLDVALRQPAGSSIGGVTAVEGRLAVWVRRADGDRVVLVDARRGTIVGEMRLGD